MALKALSLRGSRDWKAIELFEREAKVLSQLQHASIPKYIDYFEVTYLTRSRRASRHHTSLAPGASASAQHEDVCCFRWTPTRTGSSTSRRTWRQGRAYNNW